jgi:two-component system cell cycle response regulator
MADTLEEPSGAEPAPGVEGTRPGKVPVSRQPGGDAGGAPADGEETGHTDHDRTIISSRQALEAGARLVATLVVVRGPELGRHYPLRRNRVVLGRGDVADFVLQNREISRSHASIDSLRMGGDIVYRLTDLGSTNHVYVNGTQVDTHLLVDGDKIQLGGEVVLKFELHDAIDAKFHTEVRHRIHYDDLTGLLTYESFRAALSWELERYASSAKGCAVVMMDLDDFKKLNDTWGHLAGSYVLKEIGGLIRGKLRQFDVASRYGGEEFVAYLPETEATEAWTAAERLRRIIEETVFFHQERDIRITISMGISHFPQDGRELDTLVSLADERLYRAKREGKNRVYGD